MPTTQAETQPIESIAPTADLGSTDVEGSDSGEADQEVEATTSDDPAEDSDVDRSVESTPVVEERAISIVSRAPVDQDSFGLPMFLLLAGVNVIGITATMIFWRRARA